MKNTRKIKKRSAMGLAFMVVLGISVWSLGFGSYRSAYAEDAPAPLIIDQSSDGRAQLRVSRRIIAQKLPLTFNGMTDTDTLRAVLDILSEHELKAVFFVSAAQAREYPERIDMINQAGHSIGNFTLNAERDMQNLSPSDMEYNIRRAREIICEVAGYDPSYLRLYASRYTPEVLEAAAKAGYSHVDDAVTFLSYQSFSSPEQAQALINRLPVGSTVAVNLSGVLDYTEYPQATTPQFSGNATPKPTNRPSEKPKPTPTPKTEQERLLDVVEWVSAAIVGSNYSPESEMRLYMNNGSKADTVGSISTTEKSVAYLFYGLGDKAELNSVLSALKQLGAAGTFFVSAKDVESCPEQVQAILDGGHDIGVAAIPSDARDTNTAYYEMDNVIQALTGMGGVRPKYVIQPWDKAKDSILEAAGALGLKYVHWDTAMQSDATKAMGNPADIVTGIFGERDYQLKRGQVLYFRLDYYDAAPIVGRIIKELETSRNIYKVKPIGQILANEKQLFQHPLPQHAIIPDIRNKIHSDQFRGELVDVMAERFIGKPGNGFTAEETARMKAVNPLAGDSAAHICFDGWGDDKRIGDLLDMLDKYGAKATFFVRTEHAEGNPNLVRAIAEAGHEIASAGHMADSLPSTGSTIEDEDTLINDCMESYATLQRIVGDMKFDDGRPVLTRYYRPPAGFTRSQLHTLFDCGFTYVIDGTYATSGTGKLYNHISGSIQPGSVGIFNMSSAESAEALERFFAENASRPSGEQLRFGRLGDVLERE